MVHNSNQCYHHTWTWCNNNSIMVNKDHNNKDHMQTKINLDNKKLDKIKWKEELLIINQEHIIIKLHNKNSVVNKLLDKLIIKDKTQLLKLDNHLNILLKIWKKIYLNSLFYQEKNKELY